MRVYPPVIPGDTEVAEGPEHMELLANLAMMRMRNRKKFDALFDSLQKLVTPKEPPPEPITNQPQPQGSGQALASVIGQPALTGGGSMGS